jgi:WD40 repeat protein/tRNA A-37 threonylcarbamoyl transferase component Bud32
MSGSSINSVRCPRCGTANPGQDAGVLCSRCLLNAFFAPPGLPSLDASDQAADASRTFGDYEELELVARGGMGIVYRARHRTLNRITALKLVGLGHLHHPQTRQRFRLEAEAAAKLDHPNITPVYEVGEENGQPFLAMKFCEGGSLAELIQGERQPGQLNAKRAARIVAQVARAVHHAHERGVLHRDLKPANILMDSAEVPMVTDFGLARLLDQDASITATGSVLGTPAYMSPEQTAGRPDQVTIATDIWGIGTILYELLAGVPPFRGSTTAQLIRSIAEDAPPRLSCVDRDLETICLKCLAKEANCRYGSALAVAEDLERWERGEPILARPAAWAERVGKWVRRNPAQAALMAFSSLSVMAFISTLVVSQARLQTANERIQAQSEQRRQQTVRLNVAAGNRRSDDLDMGNALLWLAEGLRHDQDGGTRETGHRIRFEALLDRLPTLRQFWSLPEAATVAAISRDGSFAALGCADGKVYFKRCGTGEDLRSPITTPASVSRLFLSDDQRFILTQHSQSRWACYSVASGERLDPPELRTLQMLAVGRAKSIAALGSARGIKIVKIGTWETVGSELALGGRPNRASFFSGDTRLLITEDGLRYRVWDAGGGVLVKELRLAERPTSIKADPSGRWVVAVMADSRLHCWNVETGAKAWTSQELVLANPDFIFTASGDRVIGWGSAGNARILDVATGRPETLPFPSHNGVVSISFSPDEAFLATSGFDGNTILWDARTARHATPPIPHGLFVLGTVFAPDGRSLLTICADGTVRLWDWRPPDEVGLRLKHPGAVTSAEWSLEGRHLLTVGGRVVQVWDTKDGRSVSGPLQHPHEVQTATFSPNERELVSGSLDGMLRRWDWTSGTELAPALTHAHPIKQVRFDASGDRLLSVSRSVSAQLWHRPTLTNLFKAGERSSGWVAGPSLAHDRTVVYGEFDPSGKRVLTAGDDGVVRLWNSDSGDPIGGPLKHIGRVSEAHFSQDGTRIISASWDATIHARGALVWEVSTGKLLAGPFLLRDGVWSVALSPNGEQLAAVGEDTFGYLWHLGTGERQGLPLQHLSDIRKVCYSPNSILVGTASGDASARIWEATTGEPITPPLWHQQRVNWVGFDPTSTRVATASSDGTAAIFQLQPIPMPIEDVIQMAELMSAHELAPNGSRRPLSPKALQERWSSLSGKYPERFGKSAHSTKIR